MAGSTGRGGSLARDWGEGAALLGAVLAAQGSRAAALNWMLDRVSYRGAKPRGAAYLGTRTDAQNYLGARSLF